MQSHFMRIRIFQVRNHFFSMRIFRVSLLPTTFLVTQPNHSGEKSCYSCQYYYSCLWQAKRDKSVEKDKPSIREQKSLGEKEIM